MLYLCYVLVPVRVWSIRLITNRARRAWGVTAPSVPTDRYRLTQKQSLRKSKQTTQIKYRIGERFWSVCEKTFIKIYFPPSTKSKLPSHQVFGMIALEVNEILQTTPPKLRREMGMCGNAAIIICVQQYYTRTSARCAYSSPGSLVPGAAYTYCTWDTVHARTKQTTESEVRGSASRVKTPC